MLRLAGERDVLRVVNDQSGRPTYAPDIADAIIRIAGILHLGGWQNRFKGITHLAGPDAMTWYAFARKIFRTDIAKGALSDELGLSDRTNRYRNQFRLRVVGSF